MHQDTTLLTPEVAQRLVALRGELVDWLRKALEDTLFSNRSFVRIFDLKQAAIAEADALLAFLKTGDIAPVKAQGARRAKAGFGTPAVLRLAATLNRFGHTYLEGEHLRVGLAAINIYTDTVLESFIEAREAIILDEQERIQAALQRTLNHYTLWLQTAAEVSRAATSILNLDELLNVSVELICSRFDFFYVGLFLIDESGEWAVLRARAEGAGRERLRQGFQQGFQLRVGGETLIGWCTAYGQARTTANTKETLARFDAAVFVETCAEMALPLLTRGHVIGAMYIQSTHLSPFNDEDILTLQTMADQLANAIQNARLYQELEAYSESLRQAVEARTAELQRTKERAEAILNNSPDAILLLSADSTIQTCNEAFYTLFGYDRDEIYGQPLAHLADPAYTEVLNTSLRAPSGAHQARRIEIIARRKDESIFDAEVALAPMEAGDIATGFVCTLRDISTLKEVQRMKDAFVSNVSHELRTPISSLKLYHDLLSRNPEKGQAYMARLQRETTRLAKIVEDLLSLSRLDQSRVTMKFTPIDLNTLAGLYVTDRKPLAESRGLRLTFLGLPDLPTVLADEGLLGQALSNLLTNALNYTPAGGYVEVSTKVRCAEGKLWAGVEVSDSGPGVLPEEQPHLFERFFRGTVGRESGAPGTGLGLALVKEIIARHNGTVEVTSEGIPGKGAAFRVWLPAAAKNP